MRPSTSKTHLVGKDAPLEVTLEKMQSQLSRLGFEVEPKSWLNPVPHVWSVHLQDKHCPQLFTNGKGTSKEAALASALGEFFERLSSNYFWADYWLGPEIAESDFVHYPNEVWLPATPHSIQSVLLDETSRAIYADFLHPDALVDINSGAPHRGICALPFVRQSDQQPVLFPVNLIGNLFVSNGMAAGNTQAEAQVQALSEICERAVKNHLLSEGLCPPQIPDAVLARYPKVMAAIQALQAAGFHLQVRDASLGGIYPVINVNLLNPKDGGCFASFGAHPLFEVALERTVTELLQGRALDQLDVFAPPSFDLDAVADPHNLETHFIDSSGLVGWPLVADQADYPFTEWDFQGDTEAQRQQLLNQLETQGHSVYIAEYNHLGVAACRILVPGFSEIYPPQDLHWDNNNQGVALRDALLNLAELDRPQLADLLDQLNEQGFNDQQPVAALIGVVPGAGFWKSLRIGALKAMLCLALGEVEEALALVENHLLFGHLAETEQRHYRCLRALLEIHIADQPWQDFQSALHAYFGETEVQICTALIEGKRTFHGLTPAPGLTGLQAHQALLDAYHKVQAAKAAALSP